MEVLKKALNKVVKVDAVQTDNAVFKLHYKFTVMLLVVSCILLSTKQHFGDPIKCDLGGSSHDLQSTIETLCWIYGTYTVSSSSDQANLEVPGLGNELGREQTWHLYYQWIAVVLLIQAFFFYIPCYLWKLWEGKTLETLVKDLEGPLEPIAWDSKKEQLVTFLKNYQSLHTTYAFHYLFCELLNFVNVIIQMFLTNWLLKGKFFAYGTFLFNFQGVNEDPFSAVFPKTTKCKYKNYGPSGSLRTYDFLCVLPLNVLNEKIYLVLWLWMIVVAILSFLVVLFRLMTLFSRNLRNYHILVQIRYFDRKEMQHLVNCINFGSFFVLYRIGKNCHPSVFKELISELNKVKLKEIENIVEVKIQQSVLKNNNEDFKISLI